MPLRIYRRSLWSVAAVLFELALAAVVVIDTGFWESAFVFSLVPPVAAAGFGFGFGGALRLAGVAVAAVGIPEYVSTEAVPERVSIVWASELILVALVAGYARRLFIEAEARASMAMEEMSRLAEANELLSGLHKVAQALPASLDLADTINLTTSRVKELTRPDGVALLLRDEAAGEWEAAACDGIRLGKRIPDAGLPSPARKAVHNRATVVVSDLGSTQGPGLGFRSESGVYAPLIARNLLLGLLVVESNVKGAFDGSTAEVVDGIAPQAALALDNARWFARLRTVGADEERTRIARELHDRVGSSLAYLGFELDRITRSAGPEVGGQLQELRQDVRRVVGEVRDTLYDLRTDVSETSGLVGTLQDFVDRVGQRSQMTVTFEHSGDRRLPLVQEREMWRVAQEAITNAERHSGGSAIAVRWTITASDAVLEVSDNGRGMSSGSARRLGSYGMLGMRERADAIGAQLEVITEETRGTTVRCRLEGR